MRLLPGRSWNHWNIESITIGMQLDTFAGLSVGTMVVPPNTFKNGSFWGLENHPTWGPPCMHIHVSKKHGCLEPVVNGGSCLPFQSIPLLSKLMFSIINGIGERTEINQKNRWGCKYRRITTGYAQNLTTKDHQGSFYGLVTRCGNQCAFGDGTSRWPLWTHGVWLPIVRISFDIPKDCDKNKTAAGLGNASYTGENCYELLVYQLVGLLYDLIILSWYILILVPDATSATNHWVCANPQDTLQNGTTKAGGHGSNRLQSAHIGFGENPPVTNSVRAIRKSPRDWTGSPQHQP